LTSIAFACHLLLLLLFADVENKCIIPTLTLVLVVILLIDLQADLSKIMKGQDVSQWVPKVCANFSIYKYLHLLSSAYPMSWNNPL